MLGALALGQQYRHILADQLAAGIAEQFFGGRIERFNGALAVDDDYAIG